MPRTVRQVTDRTGGNKDRDYEVETILQSQERGGRLWFFIKWKGYDDTWNSWEPEDLMNCPDKVDEFDKRKLAADEMSQVKPSKPKKADFKTRTGKKVDDDVVVVEFAIIEQTQEPAVLFKINDQYELLPYKVAKKQDKFSIPIIDYFEKHLAFHAPASEGDALIDLK